jgi:hypothetical protein
MQPLRRLGRVIASARMSDRRCALLVVIALAACGPDKDDATGDTSSPTTSTSEPTTTPTTAGEAGDACMPDGLPACPVAQCLEEWSFSCDGCGEFVETGRCFEIAVGCAYPALACDLPSPCGRVWAQGYDTIESLEDEGAAVCLLTALRDRTPGRYELLWGNMGDPPLVYMHVFSGGDGDVLLEWTLDCEGCPNSGFFKRSGRIALQPPAWFDDCLIQPSGAPLIECVFGFTAFEPEAPPPTDYKPPWTTGDCVSLAITCPG